LVKLTVKVSVGAHVGVHILLLDDEKVGLRVEQVQLSLGPVQDGDILERILLLFSGRRDGSRGLGGRALERSRRRSDRNRLHILERLEVAVRREIVRALEFLSQSTSDRTRPLTLS